MRGSPAPERYPPTTRAPLKKKDPQEGLPGGEAHRGLDPGNRGGRPTPPNVHVLLQVFSLQVLEVCISSLSALRIYNLAVWKNL